MTDILVCGNTLSFAGQQFRCAVGRGGSTHHKKEGDGCTPRGGYALRECWYRADRLSEPKTILPTRIITPEDGWCDDPRSPEYNRHVTLPFLSSHETLWREDHVYDLIVPLGYNDDPVIPGKGSAIFLHVATPEYAPTEGCVALALPDLLEVMSRAGTTMRIHIR